MNKSQRTLGAYGRETPEQLVVEARADRKMWNLSWGGGPTNCRNRGSGEQGYPLAPTKHMLARNWAFYGPDQWKGVGVWGTGRWTGIAEKVHEKDRILPAISPNLSAFHFPLFLPLLILGARWKCLSLFSHSKASFQICPGSSSQRLLINRISNWAGVESQSGRLGNHSPCGPDSPVSLYSPLSLRFPISSWAKGPTQKWSFFGFDKYTPWSLGQGSGHVPDIG